MSKDLEDVVFQGIGEASMCWSETPKGVFDGEYAKRIGDNIMEVIKEHEQEKHEHDFDVRIGEYDLVRWCKRCGLTYVAYRTSPHKAHMPWKLIEDQETAEYLVNQA